MPKLIVILFLLLTFLTSSCGYNFVGTAPINLPHDKKNLFINFVLNPTQEAWLEPYLRSQFRDEFTRRGQVNWVSEESAEALVTIQINEFRTSDSLTARQDRTVRTTVVINMEAKFLDARTSELIWSSGQATGSSSFFLAAEDASMPGSSGPLQQRASREAVDQAVTRIADRLGERF
ncbi:DUF4136 domain-containing protein [Desulfonatronovibrio magnus]|uniref:DUF4136 domain-containing protein n=1 Tax=Desulfonatronovibrio magnus TaxID=698827 RepID=UPI000695EB61|nr:DUF4136 domain-containing protein [Desulfonatronovibrio magnus]